MTDPAAPCGAHPITEDCCCLCHEAGRAAERRRIADLASTMHATIRADQPAGARASFADYLRTYATPDPLAAYQAASNEIHDITDGPGQHAWQAFYRAWMDGVQAVEEQATTKERHRWESRIPQIVAYHRDAHDGDDCLVADLLDGDGDV